MRHLSRWREAVALLGVALLSTGCLLVEYVRTLPLVQSQLDVSEAGREFEAKFVCPRLPTGFTLAFHEAKKEEVTAIGEYGYAYPDTLLVVQVKIIDESTGKEIIVHDFTRDNMVFTMGWEPWPAINLGLGARRFQQRLRRDLQKGQVYLLRLEVVKPDPNLRTCEVFLVCMGW